MHIYLSWKLIISEILCKQFIFVYFSFKRQECVEIYYTTGDNVHVYTLCTQAHTHMCGSDLLHNATTSLDNLNSHKRM